MITDPVTGAALAIIASTIAYLFKLIHDLVQARRLNGGATAGVNLLAKAVGTLDMMHSQQLKDAGLADLTSAKTVALFDAHLGPRAIDPKGGLRWYGTESVACLEALAGKMDELGLRTDRQTDRIVAAIRGVNP